MTEKELTEKLRKKYAASPPDGMTRQDILHMSDSDLLDMDYFLLKKTLMILKKTAFTSFKSCFLLRVPADWRAFPSLSSQPEAISY